MPDDDDEPVRVALGGTPDGAAKRVLKVVKINNAASLKLTKYEVVDEDGEKVALLTFE